MFGTNILHNPLARSKQQQQQLLKSGRNPSSLKAQKVFVPNICRERGLLNLCSQKRLNSNFGGNIMEIDEVITKKATTTSAAEECLESNEFDPSFSLCLSCVISITPQLSSIHWDNSPIQTPRLGNFECFLEPTTPCVPAQYLSKMSSKDWSTSDMSFKEWSAYGVGVPLVLNGTEPVLVGQYYVPYHSFNQHNADTSTGVVNMRVDNPYRLFSNPCYSS
ncbi:hypothetical protein AMTRI_Chr07g78530 [Amborella trichopoda]